MKTNLTKIAYAFTILLALSSTGFSGDTSNTQGISSLTSLQTWLKEMELPHENPLDIERIVLDNKFLLNRQSLENFPETIGELQNLTDLSMRENQLEVLSKSLGNLTGLDTLDVSGNKLETLPDSIGDLRNLEDLYAFSNRLETLPKTIGNLTKLEVLNVSDNQLIKLPQSIGKLINLEKLIASKNKLTKLPASIENLKSLEILRIEGNPIKKLPNSIGKLENLEVIDIPKSIKNQQVLKGLENLRTILLYDDAGKEVESYLGEDKVQAYLSQFQGSFTKGAQ